MGKVEKTKAFSKLYDLLIYYSENRDQPIDNNFNFMEEVEKLCDILDLDVEMIKEEFKLNAF